MNVNQLKRMAKAIGAEIDDNVDSESLSAWAPDDHYWTETQCSVICVQYGNGGQRWKRDACKQLACMMADGLEYVTPEPRYVQ